MSTEAAPETAQPGNPLLEFSAPSLIAAYQAGDLLGVRSVAVGDSGTVPLSFTADVTGLPTFEKIRVTAAAISGQSPLATTLGSPIGG